MWIGAMAALAVPLLQSMRLSSVPARSPAWRTDLGAARMEAAQRHMPLLIDISAGWCGPCRAMDRDTWADDRVLSELDGFVVVHLDADNDKTALAGLGVGVIPQVTLEQPDGRRIATVTGYKTPGELLALLREAKKAAGP